MPDMALEPAELGELLAAHHISWFSETEQWLLAARCWGGSNKDVSPFIGYGPDSLRVMFERVEDAILRPLGLERNIGYVTQWFNRHLDCEEHCLPIAKMRIEKRIVYSIA